LPRGKGFYRFPEANRRVPISTKEIRATLCLFLTALIWGVSFVAQVVGMDFMRPFTFNAITFLLGAASLVPVILIFDCGRLGNAQLKRHGSNLAEPRQMNHSLLSAQLKQLLKYGAICGLILFAASSLQQFGVEMTGSAGKSGFITGLYIILVPIAGMFMGRRAEIFTWVGAAFAMLGMYFLCVQEGFGSITHGDAALLLGAFFWAAHIIAIDRFATKVSALKLSLLQFLVCGLLCAVCALATEPLVSADLPKAVVPLLYRGIGSIGVAYTLQIIGQRHVAPAKASVIFSLESVFSAIGGALLIHEVMNGRSYLGCGLIFAGILFSQLPLPAKNQK
jgi:drug/metabolite transporter (DMT)-like permease